MVNMTASYFPTDLLLEAISNYLAFPAVTRGLFRHILESIHKILLIIERVTLIELFVMGSDK